ncbi:hypothetical protein TNIN_485291 [Trichonephila inaurata madagascariensis]|uniref:Uncharacterized protein n=1 Tax=Trichonephila inaurata madagascariensis TaxID=2747483 RepID=A0A8X6J7Y4_9ARAC|nr:hypothetical protein TNIN_485291 [Trichonephila inaurata madagascariensis]
MDQAESTTGIGLALSTSDQVAYMSENYPLMFTTSFDHTASTSLDDLVIPEIFFVQVESAQTANSSLIFDASSCTEPLSKIHDIFQSNRPISIYIPPIFPRLKHLTTSTNLMNQSAPTNFFHKAVPTSRMDLATYHRCFHE